MWNEKDLKICLRMIVIYTPLIHVTVILVGPLHPPSGEGHTYILTLNDDAFRHPGNARLRRMLLRL